MSNDQNAIQLNKNSMQTYQNNEQNSQTTKQNVNNSNDIDLDSTNDDQPSNLDNPIAGRKKLRGKRSAKQIMTEEDEKGNGSCSPFLILFQRNHFSLRGASC